ncbi:MAG: LirA/MavJ family T4SS effector, partial [Pseudanabaena sp.]
EVRNTNATKTTSSVQPTTLNLQTRPFAPPATQEEKTLSQQQDISNKLKFSENILAKLINSPSPEPTTSVQRKPKNRLKAIAAERQMAIQAKLNIGEPNDKYEKEADETAAKVVQQINTSSQGQSVQRQESMEEEDELQMKSDVPILQRQESMEEEDEFQMNSIIQRRQDLGGGVASTDLESSIQNARGSGQALEPNLQEEMGQAMGADFSGVRVHTDAQSDQLNKSIQAKAFTTGQDVFFRQGAYVPSSRNGQELIAHELTHVVQQNGKAVQRSFHTKQQKKEDSMREPIAAVDKHGEKKRQHLELVRQSRSIGVTSAKPEEIQRRFDFDKLLLNEPELREQLFKKGINIDDLEEIQELLEDKSEVQRYLKILEERVNRMFEKSGSEKKYTRALDMALWEEEKIWMDIEDSEVSSERSKGHVELIPESGGQEEQDAFMTKIRGGKPLKDVGAAISHGEYAHRIQWYVLRMAAKEVGSTTWLRSLYKVLGASEYIKVVDSIKAPVLNYTWTLWGALVDIPASLEKEETIGNVGYSAPVNLTKDLSEGAGEMKYSMIQLAVLNRRLKRYYSAKAKKTQKRGDKVLEKMLENIETTMVSAHFTDEEIDEAKKGLQKAEKKAQKGEVVDYDERNRLAFALCGIPLQGKSL